MNHGPTASTTPRLTTSCKWPNAPKRRSNARRWKSHATFALLPRLPVSATSPQGPPSLTPPDPVALPPPADPPLYPTRRLARRGPSVPAIGPAGSLPRVPGAPRVRAGPSHRHARRAAGDRGGLRARGHRRIDAGDIDAGETWGT